MPRRRSVFVVWKRRSPEGRFTPRTLRPGSWPVNEGLPSFSGGRRPQFSKPRATFTVQIPRDHLHVELRRKKSLRQRRDLERRARSRKRSLLGSREAVRPNRPALERPREHLLPVAPRRFPLAGARPRHVEADRVGESGERCRNTGSARTGPSATRRSLVLTMWSPWTASMPPVPSASYWQGVTRPVPLGNRPT
jgi:hypothetical protein